MGQDIAVTHQLFVDKGHGLFPETAAWLIEQDHGHQRALAGLNQGQYFEGFIQGAEATRAEHQAIRLLDEEQLAQEEEVERQ
ncbi:hypothetical protein FQZ97_902430 [compost metagenome]